ncbi:origin recognition complex subunit 2 isoform X1 [Oncorhynchus keta]|uniref:origin recognition complex subunit 2 isoform X1 n=1 Tax=Oncorhynchus keta TaxID=8018 RepID=UPI00227BD67E|nr:origin recognition complex subunit 2 isoform X1 [Oncorhynchus keta]
MCSMSILEVRFVGDTDALEHMVDKEQDVQGSSMQGSSMQGSSMQRLVTQRSEAERSGREDEAGLSELHYVQVLGTDEGEECVAAAAGGGAVFTFQTVKRSNRMSQMASELARTPSRSVTFRTTPETSGPAHNGCNASENRTPQKGRKVQFVSTTPHRLRKRLSAPSLRSDSDSELSPSDSGEEEEEDDEDDKGKREEDRVNQSSTPSKPSATALYKTPAKKSKTAPDPPCRVSHPEPPCQVSHPEPPCQVSHPEPPCQVSHPEPPCQVSLPEPPCRVSHPEPPCRVNHPDPPCRVSLPEPPCQASLVEEYFEAHGSSKFLTSDRTLQRLHTPKLDRETLFRLLEGKPACYSSEIEKLHSSHHEHFNKWMLQLQLGYSVLLYGLGSKKALLEEFRVSLLCQEIHLVVNGFFPSISLKSILTALSAEILEHQGTFRNPADQLQYITTTLREQPDLHVYLLIHNIDGPMLRGGKTQNALGQLASLPNLHLVASIDHINAPLVWDQCKLSQFNWLWWECVCFQRYVEETSYENSLLVQQTGALALSSLTHVLRSLTANARGIFKLLVEFQLDNKDNPSYTGLSFQDFYQRCREAFLVNSDLTLRTQLTEFRDHKLIRTRKGADGVEYLLVAVETSTLTDFLEKEVE